MNNNIFKGLETKTTDELNNLRKYHDSERIKQLSIAANNRRTVKANIVSEMMQEVDLKKLHKKYSEQGIIAAYLQTGVVTREDKEFYDELDISDLSKFCATELNNPSKRMEYVNKYHIGLAMHNDLNPWKHIYMFHKEKVDNLMSQGECFSNIICMLECHDKKAREISEHYKELRMYHDRMLVAIDRIVSSRG